MSPRLEPEKKNCIRLLLYTTFVKRIIHKLMCSNANSHLGETIPAVSKRSIVDEIVSLFTYLL